MGLRGGCGCYFQHLPGLKILLLKGNKAGQVREASVLGQFRDDLRDLSQSPFNSDTRRAVLQNRNNLHNTYGPATVTCVRKDPKRDPTPGSRWAGAVRFATSAVVEKIEPSPIISSPDEQFCKIAQISQHLRSYHRDLRPGGPETRSGTGIWVGGSGPARSLCRSSKK